jgi:uncharacterized protein YbjT (DUF2867 family)
MSTYKSFAVVGAGGLGTPVVEALLAKNVPVVVLSRSSKPIPSGAKLEVVNYGDKAQVTQVLKSHNVDVVVSTLSGEGFGAQVGIAEAAKDAGVKLFAPSEFGMPTKGHKDGFLAYKDSIAVNIGKIIPTARFYTGFFIGDVLGGIPWVLGAFDGTNKLSIIGKGNTAATWTSERDIAGYLAHVFTTLPPSQLENKTFYIQGDQATLLQIADLYKGKFEVQHVDKIPGDDIRTMLLQAIEAGYANNSWEPAADKLGSNPADADNHLWQGHQWKTIKQTLNL